MSVFITVVIVLGSVGAGFALGLVSKVIIKKSMSKWINDQIIDLDKQQKEAIRLTQEQCNLMVQKAQYEALELYNKAYYNTSEDGVKNSSTASMN